MLKDFCILSQNRLLSSTIPSRGSFVNEVPNSTGVKPSTSTVAYVGLQVLMFRTGMNM